MLNYALNNIFN